jgi:hypothetical protein
VNLQPNYTYPTVDRRDIMYSNCNNYYGKEVVRLPEPERGEESQSINKTLVNSAAEITLSAFMCMFKGENGR